MSGNFIKCNMQFFLRFFLDTDYLREKCPNASPLMSPCFFKLLFPKIPDQVHFEIKTIDHKAHLCNQIGQLCCDHPQSLPNTLRQSKVLFHYGIKYILFH